MISSFLQQLIDDNTLTNYMVYCSGNYGSDFSSAFTWWKTKEGASYWNRLYNSKNFKKLTKEDLEYLTIHYPELLI